MPCDWSHSSSFFPVPCSRAVCRGRDLLGHVKRCRRVLEGIKKKKYFRSNFVI